jgi:hypothetical protein
MPKNTQVDTGQEPWSSRNPRFSHPVQSPYAHQDGYPTPITSSAMGFPQSSQSSQAGPSRSRKAAAMQMEIDGMENKAREMTINEPSDGRVGVEKPCEYSLAPWYEADHVSLSRQSPPTATVLILNYRRRTRLHRDQRIRRWIIRDSVPMRLALAHQGRPYAISNAKWSRSKTGMDRKEASRAEKDETRLGRRMG